MIPCSHEEEFETKYGSIRVCPCNAPSTKFFSNDPGHGIPELSEFVFGRCDVHSKFELKFKTTEISREEYLAHEVVNS